METTVNFYEERLWDLTVQNNRTTLTDLMHYLIGCMRDRYIINYYNNYNDNFIPFILLLIVIIKKVFKISISSANSGHEQQSHKKSQ